MKKMLFAAALLMLPALAMAASVTVKPTYNEPATECRAQSVENVTLAAKTGSYDFTTTGVAKYLFDVKTATDAAANVDVIFGTLTTARWRAASGTIVPNATSGVTAKFRNYSGPAGVANVAKTLRLLKCH